MMERRISINGEATRVAISELTGKRNGIRPACEERGLAPETVNQICRQGYGTPETINRCLAAGLPIIISKDPVPCRRRKPHLRLDSIHKKPRGSNREKAPEQRIISETSGRQVTFDDLEMNPVKELLISHLEALIEDLKKI